MSNYAGKTEEQLLNEIVRFDCEPGVYNVMVNKSGFVDGITVVVVFRGGHEPRLNEISFGGEEILPTLITALEFLNEHYSKCPECGGYRHGA